MRIPQRLSTECVVQRQASIICAEAGNDVVMVSIESGFYYAVSDVAVDIWNQIEGPTRVSDLIDSLCASYNVDRCACENDTLAFLDQLLADQLLQVVS